MRTRIATRLVCLILTAAVFLIAAAVMLPTEARAVTYPLSSPTLKTLSNTASGVKLSWNAVSGAEKYAIYRKIPGGSWVKKGVVAETTFTDTTAYSGTLFSYKVRCISDDGTTLMSPNPEEKSILYLKVPTLYSVTNTETGIRFNFSLPKGAQAFQIYRRVGTTGSFQLLDTVESAPYIDTSVQVGTTYSYKVRAVNTTNDAKSVLSGKSDNIKFLISPAVSSLKVQTGGVKLTWEPVKGAVQYAVLRKAGSGSWCTKAITTSTSFRDSVVYSGTKYQYKVRCVDSTGKKYQSANPTVTAKVTYMKAPKFSAATPKENGVLVSWSRVSNASSYIIYRKLGSGSWVKKGTVAGTERTFLDTTAKGGSTYTYTLRSVAADGAQSARYTSNTPITYVKVPTVTLSNAKTGVKVSWNRVAGAEAYRVLRRVGEDGTWTTKATVTGTGFTDTTAYSGTSFSYKVRAVTQDGSAYTCANPSTAPVILYLRMPVISGLRSTNEGVKITLSRALGTDSCKIYRKTASGSWTLIGTTDTTSFTDTNVAAGMTYTYTARAVAADGTESARDTVGSSIAYIAAPEMRSVTNVSQGIEVTWEDVPGVNYYRVFRKYGEDGEWTSKDIVQGTSFVDENVFSGSVYSYTVRCMADDQETYLSGRDEEGIRIVFLRQPPLKSVENVHGGVLVKFSTVTGAASYEILRDDGSGFQTVGFTTENHYLDHTVEFGTDYSYTVRAITTGSSLSQSSYDSEGLSIRAEDISYTAYVQRPFVYLFDQYTDDDPKWMAMYMTEVQYLETTKEYESGSWIMVLFDSRICYLWQPAGENYLTKTQSSFEYRADTLIGQEMLDLAMEMYRFWPVAYRHGESNGVIAHDGTYGYDCSGFASYVLKTVMQKHVPTYWVTAAIEVLYGTQEIYNHGLNGAFSAVDVDPADIAPGDLLFFDLADETEFDSQEPDKPVTHCGIYLGNNEFMHCTHFDTFGVNGLFISPLTYRYRDSLVAVRRYTPESPTPADQTMYTASYVNVRRQMSSESELEEVLAPETEVTVLYTGSAQVTTDPVWAYISYGEDQTGFVMLQYLMPELTEEALTMYVSATSIRLYSEPDTDSEGISVLIGEPVVYCGRYGATSYLKVNYQGLRYYVYCPEDEDLDQKLTEDLETLMAGIGTRTVIQAVNLRSNMDSSTEDSILTLLPAGTSVTLIAVSSSGTWCYVRTEDGLCGFVGSKYLD